MWAKRHLPNYRVKPSHLTDGNLRSDEPGIDRTGPRTWGSRTFRLAPQQSLGGRQRTCTDQPKPSQPTRTSPLPAPLDAGLAPAPPPSPRRRGVREGGPARVPGVRAASTQQATRLPLAAVERTQGELAPWMNAVFVNPHRGLSASLAPLLLSKLSLLLLLLLEWELFQSGLRVRLRAVSTKDEVPSGGPRRRRPSFHTFTFAREPLWLLVLRECKPALKD